jgi:hypothetical protein
MEGDEEKELALYRRRAALTASQQELLASPVERHYAKHRRRAR